MPPKSANDLKNINPAELRNKEPWDQLPDETAKSYRAFLIYRNMPPEERTIIATWKIYNPAKAESYVSAHFHQWARDNKWEERALAWDRHFNHLKDRSTEKTFQKELVEERGHRQDLLNAMYSIVAQYAVWVNGTEKTPTKLRALAAAAATYMEQSRREYGDDPLSERQREEELKEGMESVQTKIHALMAEVTPEERAGTNPSYIQ